MPEQPKPAKTPPETQIRNVSTQLETLTATLQQTLDQMSETHHAASLKKTLIILTKQAAKLTNTADVLQYEQQTAVTPGVQAKMTVERLPRWAVVGISSLCGTGAFLIAQMIVERFAGNILDPHSWSLLLGLVLMSGSYLLSGAITAWLNREQAEKLALIAGVVLIALNFLAGDVSGWGWLRVALALPGCLFGSFMVPKLITLPPVSNKNQPA